MQCTPMLANILAEFVAFTIMYKLRHMIYNALVTFASENQG